MDETQFQDMGSAPATIEASRMCIMKGLFKGNSLGQADAMQAYIQARLGGTETWVEIPEEGWPEEWRKNGPPCDRPCCKLIQALYGHPDSGTFWEKHADKAILLHPSRNRLIPGIVRWRLPDVRAGGNMNMMWERIGKVIQIEDPGPMGLYLGCIHEEGSMRTEDGRTVRPMTFNQEGFFPEKVEKYLELCLDKGGKEVKLASVKTPLRQRNSERKLRAEAREIERTSSYVEMVQTCVRNK